MPIDTRRPAQAAFGNGRSPTLLGNYPRPSCAYALTPREAHTAQITCHLPAAAKPRPGERCILCAGPADRVVLGPIERDSGLQRRTPVCTKCANASGRLERRMVGWLFVE